MIKDCSGWRHHRNPSLDETNSNFKQGEKLWFQNRLVPHPKTLRLNFLVILRGRDSWHSVVEFNLVICLVQYQCLGILMCDSFAETSYFSMSLNYTFNWFSVFSVQGIYSRIWIRRQRRQIREYVRRQDRSWKSVWDQCRPLWIP